MSLQDAEPPGCFHVVVNEEEQYSIWPEAKQVPAGWRVVRDAAPKEDCLAYVEEVWTDIRPLSLRRRMAASAPTGEATAGRHDD